MGILYGARLCCDPNNVVTYIDHSPGRANFLRSNGIAIHENGIINRFRVNAVLTGDTAAGNYDWIFILVKAHQTQQALHDAGKHLPPDATIVSLQNGLGNCETIAAFVPAENIIAGISNHNSTKLHEGEIIHPTPAAETIIGPFSGTDTTKAQDTAALFTASGSRIKVVHDIYPHIWRKLLVNMAINPLTMISGKKNGFVASDPALWQQVKILLEEGIAAARCRGVRLDYNEMLQHIHNICILTADGTSSMLQDRIFCRKTEIDHINGAIAAIAAENNAAAPFNRRLTSQVHKLEESFS